MIGGNLCVSDTRKFSRCLIHKEKDIVFYAGTKIGIIRITPEATELFSTTQNTALSIWNNNLYDYYNEYSLVHGKVVVNRFSSTRIHAVGFGWMEKIDNERDTVTFYDMKGKSAGEFGLLQNTFGIFLDERTFFRQTDSIRFLST